MQIQNFKKSIPALNDVSNAYAKQKIALAAERSRHSRQTSQAVSRINKQKSNSKNQQNGNFAYVKVGNSVERIYDNLPTSLHQQNVAAHNKSKSMKQRVNGGTYSRKSVEMHPLLSKDQIQARNLQDISRNVRPPSKNGRNI